MSSDETLAIRPLRSFTDRTAALSWRPLHDGVMGGRSSGAATFAGEAAHLEGEVRKDNGGGFASYRIDLPGADVAGADGLRLRVRGDGQVYKVALRSEPRGVSWQVPFGTSNGEWTAVHVPLAALVPTWRGRFVEDAAAFDAGSVGELGVLIADEQFGRYSIDVATIEAWSTVGDARPGSRAARRERTEAIARSLDAGGDCSELVERLRGAERGLVVASRDMLGAASSKQLGRFYALDGELAARDVRIVQLLGERSARVAGRTLAADAVAALRARWVLPADEWAVALVGKDGAVKARWSEPVQPSEVFECIDAMPQRVEELARRRRD